MTFRAIGRYNRGCDVKIISTYLSDVCDVFLDDPEEDHKPNMSANKVVLYIISTLPTLAKQHWKFSPVAFSVPVPGRSLRYHKGKENDSNDRFSRLKLLTSRGLSCALMLHLPRQMVWHRHQQLSVKLMSCQTARGWGKCHRGAWGGSRSRRWAINKAALARWGDVTAPFSSVGLLKLCASHSSLNTNLQSCPRGKVLIVILSLKCKGGKDTRKVLWCDVVITM